MNPPTTQHPDRAALEAYGLGLQSPPAADAIERHVAVCEPCGQMLAAVRDDWLVGLLRSSTAAEPAAATRPHSLDTHTANPPGASSPPSEVPAELVNHPRYRILGRLGAGGMGVVYKAEHRLLNQHVALKVIHRHLFEEPKAVARFQQEIKTVAGLSHPNIVKARDAEETAGMHYLVMDYVEGVTLAQLVRERGPLPMVQACDYVRQAALGLQHAFERGVVHRDLKPQNLLVQFPGVVMILDFGLARFVRESDHALTHSGVMMGTPDFVAPEQATDAHQADIRADIYSLGCTLYFLLTGQPPFPTGTSVEKVLAHLRQRPRPLRELRPDLPVGLVRVVERMMAREPAQRYQTPAEVVAALTPFVTPVPVIVRSGPRRRWPLVAAAIASVVAVVGLIVALSTGDRSNQGGEPAAKGPKAGKKEDPPPVEKKPPEEKEAAKKPEQDGPAKQQRQLRRYVGHAKAVHGLAFAPDGGSFLSGSEKDLWLWDVEKEKVQRRFGGKDGPVGFLSWIRSAAISPDGRYALSGSSDGFVRIWEVASGKEVDRVGEERKGFSGEVKNVAFSPDKRHFLYTANNVVRLCEVATRKEVRPFPGEAACFSADGSKILSARDGIVTLWDTATGDELKTFKGHYPRSQITRVVLSPDGRRAASTGFDFTLRIWDLDSGKELHCCRKGHGDAVIHSLAFSPDSRRLLSGGGDGTARLWDVATGQELYRFDKHTGPVNAVAFSPDGQQALTADAVIYLWTVPK